MEQMDLLASVRNVAAGCSWCLRMVTLCKSKMCTLFVSTRVDRLFKLYSSLFAPAAVGRSALFLYDGLPSAGYVHPAC